MRETIALTAFTERGRALAERLADALGGSVRGEDQPLADWTRESFSSCAALVFIGAAGIAVRTVAPYLVSKASDPAVICLDEGGRWVVPLLSGHLGGANALARRIAALTGGEAVITTATDVNGRFAVDLWAKKQGMALLQPERIKNVSAKILRGETVTIDCPWPVAGSAPELVRCGTDADAVVSYRKRAGSALQLVPRVLTLGVGCKRGTGADALEAAFQTFCTERGIVPEAVECAASIDLKRDEAGLLSFCLSHGWPLRFYSAEELRGVPGEFSASAFVERVTGVDNVCERAAALCAGQSPVERKFARGGVTFALAERQKSYDWRWQDG